MLEDLDNFARYLDESIDYAISLESKKNEKEMSTFEKGEPLMQQTIQISTPDHNGLSDITREVEAIVAESGVQSDLVNVYVQGATAGIMI